MAACRQWYEQCVANGIADPKSVKQGALELLAPDKVEGVVPGITPSTTWGLLSYRLNLLSTANSDQIKSCARFEMYVSEMAIDGSGALARG